MIAKHYKRIKLEIIEKKLATTSTQDKGYFMSNPLLETNDLPEFTKIKAEHIQPAIIQRIEACKACITQVLKEPHKNWDNFIKPLEEHDNLLEETWSPVSHLNSVVNSQPLREAYESCLPLLSEYSTFVGQHQQLYQAYLEIKSDDNFEKLSQAQKTYIQHTIRDFQLSGVALKDIDKQRYGEIIQRLSELSNQFNNNVLDATQSWVKHITDAQLLAGLPESAFATAEAEAKRRKKSGWLFTLQVPSYHMIMTYADNEALRKEMYTSYVTRASEQGPNASEFDNTVIIDEILALRHELANLLSFDNYAEKSLATKMAHSCDEVGHFLQDLADKSKQQAEIELDELTQFAHQHGQVDTLQPWDVAYYSEKRKQYLYELSEEQLRPYFPEKHVLHGLFYTVNKLFNIRIEQKKAVNVWHKDIRYYEVFDEFNDLKGGFYLDLYTRPNKRGGAWMDVCKERKVRLDNSIQHPVAYLTCNFNPPVNQEPALFTHDEVVTLFHEFGHTLHHILTEMDVIGVAGINGVAWDAVELPSQFLENWCYQPEALNEISGHYQTKQPLPKAMLDKLLKSKNFHSAMQMLRQIEFSMFDFNIHMNYEPNLPDHVQRSLDQVRQNVAVINPPDFHRFQHSFTHIFGGGYAAGYYSYKWAEVLSADAFAKFEEDGIFNPQTGKSFLNNILQKGGSLPAMALFRAFRGREPNIQALLKHTGILNTVA
jgi:oligopeptidase A